MLIVALLLRSIILRFAICLCTVRVARGRAEELDLLDTAVYFQVTICHCLLSVTHDTRYMMRGGGGCESEQLIVGWIV